MMFVFTLNDGFSGNTGTTPTAERGGSYVNLTPRGAVLFIAIASGRLSTETRVLRHLLGTSVPCAGPIPELENVNVRGPRLALSFGYKVWAFLFLKER